MTLEVNAQKKDTSGTLVFMSIFKRQNMRKTVFVIHTSILKV